MSRSNKPAESANPALPPLPSLVVEGLAAARAWVVLWAVVDARDPPLLPAAQPEAAAMAAAVAEVEAVVMCPACVPGETLPPFRLSLVKPVDPSSPFFSVFQPASGPWKGARRAMFSHLMHRQSAACPAAAGTKVVWAAATSGAAAVAWVAPAAAASVPDAPLPPPRAPAQPPVSPLVPPVVIHVWGMIRISPVVPGVCL